MKGCVVVTIAAAIACVIPDSLTAQSWEVTPHVGLHTAVGLLLEGRDPTDNSLLRRRQLGATSIGVRLAFRTAGRLGFETNATYSPSLIAITDREATRDLGGRVFMGNIKALYRVAGDMRKGDWTFHAGPGVGVVHRYGEGWNGTDGTTDLAMVLAGRGRLARLNSNKAFIFTIEDYVTRAAFRTNAEAEPRIHHDVVYSLGMSIPLARR